MARRTHAALGRDVTLIPTWSGPLGEELAGTILLPGDGARIAPTTFEQWLASIRPTGGCPVEQKLAPDSLKPPQMP